MLHIFQRFQMTLWRTGRSPGTRTQHSWDVQTWEFVLSFPLDVNSTCFSSVLSIDPKPRVTNGPASQPPWKCHAGVNKNTRWMFHKELQLALNYSGFHLGQPKPGSPGVDGWAGGPGNDSVSQWVSQFMDMTASDIVIHPASVSHGALEAAL